MTGKELYAKVKGMMADKQITTINDEFILYWINNIYQELFKLHNDIRLVNDLPPQTFEALTSLDQEINIRSELENALLYGVISLSYFDDDLQKYSIFNVRYQNELIKCQVLVPRSKIGAWL